MAPNRVVRSMLVAVLATAGLFAHSAPASAQWAGRLATAKVAFPADKDVVEIPFELDRDKIVLPIRVNGSQPLRFVVDTGAPVMVLMKTDVADEIDLEIVGEVNISGAGEGDPGSAPLAGNVTFDIGGVMLTEATMVVGVGDELPDTGFEGIVGSDLFRDLIVEFDFDNRTLRLYRPETFNYEGAGTSLPLSFARGVFPVVMTHVSVDGNAAVPAALVIDTGAGHALSLTVETHADLGMPTTTIESMLGWGASGPITGRSGRVTSLQIGDYVFGDVVASFPKPGSVPIFASRDVPHHGYLGIKTFKRFRAIFDYPNSRLILQPTALFNDPFVWNRSGLLPRPTAPGATSLEVADVVERSPAHAAGIDTGDHITAIDGTPVANIAPGDIERILTQTPGTAVMFTIRRGEEELERKVILEDLI